MVLVDSRKLSGIVRRTLGYVDGRLIQHGERVAYEVLKMLQYRGGYTEKELRNYCLLALIHDIGAYKTEEIDNLVQFETANVWNHSVYGYLFIKYLSPVPQLAPVILYHHLDYREFQNLHEPCEDIAQIFNIADRMDVYWSAGKTGGEKEMLERYADKKFSREVIDLFLKTDVKEQFYETHRSDAYMDELLSVLSNLPFTEGEIHQTLSMLVSAIDFRSYYTVIHTITTTSISVALGMKVGLDKEELGRIYYGALLHDLGKIGVPVEILEYPGRLSTQAMNIMKDHVTITGMIMGDEIAPVVTNIALRHHEKLDGSGYPKGVPGEDLTVSERIVAIADIISALGGKRSYKDAYDKTKIIGIIESQAAQGLLDKDIVRTAVLYFDEILSYTEEQSAPFLQMYNTMTEEYQILMDKYSEGLAQI